MRVVRRAPGKVNLCLLVGPPREDGYHPLFTVFAPVDIWDDLAFDLEVAQTEVAQGEVAQDGLEVVCPGVPSQENLVKRALELLGSRAGCRIRGLVQVRKGIPSAAGLGGASSDAAVALQVGCEVLKATGVAAPSWDELEELARELGADVPFFLDPRPSRATGVGEIIEALPLPNLPLVLVLPEEQLSTALVYREFDRRASAQSSSAQGQTLFAERVRQAEDSWMALSSDWESDRVEFGEVVERVAALLQNDLEPASVGLVPPIAARRSVVEESSPLPSLMSGSGPTLFALCVSFSEAERLAAELTSRGLSALPVTAGVGFR